MKEENGTVIYTHSYTDKETGEKTFREIVGAMKKGSENALEEFKRNNEK